MRFLCLLLITWPLISFSSQDQNYGLGGPSTGRVSSVTAEVENPFAALYNPALISAQESSLFSFTTGAMSARTQGFTGVLVDSPQYRTERGLARTQDFKLPDQKVVLWSAGFTYPFSFPKSWNRRGGFGLTFSGPYERLRSFTSLTPYDFSLLRYGNSDSQFKGTVALSGEIVPKYVYAGGGLSLFLNSAGFGDTTLIADNPTGRLALDIGFNTAIVAGIFARFEPTRFALVYRQEINPTFEQRFEGKVQIGGVDTLKQPFTIKTSLYFEPQVLEAEAQHDFGFLVASAGVSYQIWERYKPSYLVVEATDSNGAARSTTLPSLSLKNTFNPRASLEVPLFAKAVVVSGGYQYRPTPLNDVSGMANLLDSTTHVGGLSVRHRISPNEVIPVPVTWGVYGQYHWMNSRRVEKSSPDFIGAPKYDFSGSAYTYGLSLQAEL